MKDNWKIYQTSPENLNITKSGPTENPKTFENKKDS